MNKYMLKRPSLTTIILIHTLVFTQDATFARIYGGNINESYDPNAFLGGFIYPDPAFVDIDNDNDLDLFIGNEHRRRGLLYFENDPDVDINNWQIKEDNFLALDDSIAKGWSRPAVGDIDGDGDYDLIINYWDYPIPENVDPVRFFINVGSETNSEFIELSNEQIIEPALDGSFEDVELIDINNDGRLEMIGSTNHLITFENYSNTDSVMFVEENIGFDISLGDGFNIAFGDIDNDGDFDLLIGLINEIRLYENVGTAEQANFLYVNDFFEDVVFPEGYSYSPTFADLDSDSDLDLIWGMESWDMNGQLYCMFNEGSPENIQWGAVQHINTGLDFGQNMFPALGDLDGDGDEDMVLTGEDFLTHDFSRLMINEGEEQPEWNFYQDSFFPSGYSVFYDLDSDGDEDAISGDYFYENNSSDFEIIFNEQPWPFWELTSTIIDTFNNGWLHHFDLEDLDSDGDADVVGIVNYLYLNIVDKQAIIVSFNEGTPENPGFLNFNVVYPHSVDRAHDILLIDIDNDSDFDIITLKTDYSVQGWVWDKQIIGLHRNIGDSFYPEWNDPEDYYLYDLTLPSLLSVTKGDVDNDQDIDLLFGTKAGGLVLLVNDSTTMNISTDNKTPLKFHLTACYPNPFNASINIRWDIAKQMQYNLSVFDLLGREVCVLSEGKNTGEFMVSWNGTSEEGVPAASGIYIIMLKGWSDGNLYKASKKILLLK